MKPSIAKKWIAALLSGKYKQTKGRLRRYNTKAHRSGYCCLGVLTDLYCKEKHCTINKLCKGQGTWSGGGLYPEVQLWSGVSGELGEFSEGDTDRDLAALNDSGRDFNDIAQIISEHVKDL